MTNANSIYAIETGATVTGLYMGEVAYTGIVSGARAHTMNHKICVFSIDLLEPVMVFDQLRTDITINASDDLEASRRFNGGIHADTIQVSQ